MQANMTKEQIDVLKLCAKAFYIRYHRTGLNTWDSDAYDSVKLLIKSQTGELYANGEWYKDEWGNKNI